MSFILPEVTFDQHIIVLGKTRSGKSSAMRVLVERLLDQEKPVCVIDPKGDWWGLKSSASGKSAGYPVVIFGGEHADIPLNAQSGGPVAELVATGNRSCIIDLGGWMPGDRTHFWIDFASTYFRTHRGRHHLVIDEVHNLCPKGKIMDPNAGKMLHWSNRLASEGLGKGISMIAASQRPQKVHNDFLTSCETLIGMRVIHKADRDAISDWIDGCADPEKSGEVLRTIASMKRGEAWVWSPEADFGPKLIQFPMFATYDSFKAQGIHEGKLKGWAAVDLDVVRKKLESVVKEAEAKDPEKLAAKIRELQKQLRAQPKDVGARRAVPTPDPRAIERAVKTAQQEAQKQFVAIHASRKKLMANGGQLARALMQLAEAAKKSFLMETNEDQHAAVPAKLKFDPPRYVHPVDQPKQSIPEIARKQGVKPIREPEKLVMEDDGEIPRSQRKILGALAQFEALGKTDIKKSWIAALAGVSSTSSGFTNNLGALRTRGLIDYRLPGTAALTDAGRDAAPKIDPPASSAEMLERCIGIITEPQRKILRALHAAYPEALDKEKLAELAEASATSSGYTNNLGALRSAGMIDYPSPGHARCADWLFID
jgi:hypothetical protein